MKPGVNIFKTHGTSNDAKVSLLLQAKADPNEISYRWNEQRTPLCSLDSGSAGTAHGSLHHPTMIGIWSIMATIR